MTGNNFVAFILSFLADVARFNFLKLFKSVFPFDFVTFLKKRLDKL